MKCWILLKTVALRAMRFPEVAEVLPLFAISSVTLGVLRNIAHPFCCTLCIE